MVPLVPSRGPKSRQTSAKPANPAGDGAAQRMELRSDAVWKLGIRQAMAQKRNTGTPDARRSLHKYYSKPI